MTNSIKTSYDKKWTIIEILSWTASYFKSYGIDSSRVDAEILLSEVLNLKRIELYLQYDKPLLSEEITAVKELIIRRKKREPVAYITGIKEFRSMDFAVTKNVLIPRPDTEILVEAAIEIINNKKYNDPKLLLKIIELGVGSGAVISAVASSNPQYYYFGTDNSEQALIIAKKNILKHNLKIELLISDWFSGLKESKSSFDMIISNPPYIPSEEIENLAPEIRLYEPLSSIDGGIDGLDSIRRIVADAHFYLNNEGLLLLEIGFDQKEKVMELIDSTTKYKNIETIRDYGGNDRVLIMTKR